MSIVASNVANAETPGYVRKTPAQVTTAAGAVGVGVRVAAINRELDQYIQRQMRVESSGAGYAGLRAEFYNRLQTVYGVPGAVSTLETAYNDFMGALQALSTSPELPAARTRRAQRRAGAHAAAQQHDRRRAGAARATPSLALPMRSRRANEAMTRIAADQSAARHRQCGDATTANLLDQRDVYIDQLAQLMDINVVRNDYNQVSVFTNSGIQLVGHLGRRRSHSTRRAR